jgi:hypothetical protein
VYVIIDKEVAVLEVLPLGDAVCTYEQVYLSPYFIRELVSLLGPRREVGDDIVKLVVAVSEVGLVL